MTRAPTTQEKGTIHFSLPSRHHKHRSLHFRYTTLYSILQKSMMLPILVLCQSLTTIATIESVVQLVLVLVAHFSTLKLLNLQKLNKKEKTELIAQAK